MSNNFQKKIYLLKLFFLLLFAFGNSLKSTGQGYEIGDPYYRNIAPNDYGFESQNYSITQDKSGRIFIGNVNNILIYDGHSWKSIPLKGTPRFANREKDSIFVAGFKRFGFLQNNYMGQYEFVNLLDSSHAEINSQIVKLCNYNGEIFFHDNKNIYKYVLSNLTKIKLAGRYINFFKVNDKFYLVNDSNLFEYNKTNLHNVKLPNHLKNDLIIDILTYSKDKVLIWFDKHKFYLYDTNSKQFKKFTTPLDNLVSSFNYVESIKVNDNCFVIGTNNNGIIFFDKHGEIINFFNQDNGLINNNITKLFIDRSKNLWILTNYGMSILQTNFQFTFFDRNSGLTGGLSNVYYFNHHVYVASLQGIYILSDTCTYKNETNLLNHKRFSLLPELNFETNAFLKIENQLFCTSNQGLYNITSQPYRKMSNWGCQNIYHLKFDPSKYLVVGDSGIYIFKFSDNNFSINKFQNCNINIRTFAEDGNTFWFGSDHEGLFKMNISDSITFLEPFISVNKLSGLPTDFNWIDVYNTSGGILFSTNHGVYRYNKINQTFFLDSLLGLDFSLGKIWVYPIIEDYNKNLWFCSGETGKFKKQTYIAKFNGIDKPYELISRPLSPIDNYTIEGIYIGEDSIVWFSTMKNLIRFNYKNSISEHYDTLNILIHSIKIGKDSILNLPNNFFSMKNNISINYANRDIHVEVAIPDFSGSQKEFSFFLEGYEQSYSKWIKENFKEYTNISPGKYKLFVKAKVDQRELKKIITIPFIIQAPYYLSYSAFIYYVIFILVVLFLILSWRNFIHEKEKFNVQQLLSQRTEELVYQKERAEQLLSKILPQDTAKQIQKKGKADRKSYKMVTVLFADIKGFTKITENTPPEELLDELDTLFLKFDTLMEEMGIEKIKTIGDAYMCAGGIPKKNRTNPIDIILSGMKMLEYLEEINNLSKTKWQIRIGVHTGPVIAGVVGTRKISYDIWGDTVNVASRMEAMGEGSEINISESTYELVSKYFECIPRGMIPVKYKGNISMYFVKGFKPEYAADNTCKIPNDAFRFQLQHIRFTDLEELMLTKLEKGLPSNLYYHNLKHTIDVINQSELIGRGENCTDEEILILKTAALFHDAGHIISYDDHEEQGIKLAKEILPQYKYSQDQIKLISELIYATKLPPNPKNLLQSIICDADLDYLGREDFVPVSNQLFKELSERKKVKSIEEWNKLQIIFLGSHHYFTKTARDIRRVNKLKQLEKLQNYTENSEE